MAANRPEIDWIGIQASYRSGQLPTLEIARRHGVTEGAIRYRAKRERWQKDLSPEYQAGVKAAVLREPYESAPRTRKIRKGATGDRARDILVAAIDEGKRVVIKHQELGELLSDNSRRLAEIIKGRIDNAEGLDEKQLSFLVRAHDALTRAAVNAIAIERQARGLEHQPADPSMPAAINITYYRQNLVLPRVEGPEQPPAIEVEQKRQPTTTK
jgi:hypothetical protein